ncbi:glutathione hydrolase 1 proenzyme-like [Haliotis rubra]|uniref:glutathione hydrolase 1 proenzyme-like n=1 Tax=Haliotis rubra TaxID=36100 RepID=UPI001EE62C38|nr:glutathione hydrolase 1 proenzyme-like [Haliotis rubra]
MTSREFGDSIRAMISDNMTHDTQYYGPTYYTRPDRGTSQISVVDALGNAVALTSTINFAFGSKVLGNSTGIIFNNEMDDFSTPGAVNGFGVPSSPANFIKPNKRPQSSMTPSVVVDDSGDVILVIGASGGTRITTAVTQVTLQTLKFGRSAAKSVDYMRVHHQLLPDNLRIEDGFPQEIRAGLMSKGHITEYGNPVSNVVLVRVTNNTKYGVSDWRKGGTPDGY